MSGNGSTGGLILSLLATISQSADAGGSLTMLNGIPDSSRRYFASSAAEKASVAEASLEPAAPEAVEELGGEQDLQPAEDAEIAEDRQVEDVSPPLDVEEALDELESPAPK